MLRAARRLFSPARHIANSLEASLASDGAINGLYPYRSRRIQLLPIHDGARVVILALITAATVILAQHVDVRNPYSPSRMIGAAHYAFDQTTIEVREVIARAEPRFLRPHVSAFEAERQMSSNELLDRWKPFIREASARFRIPAAWIRAVIKAESGGRTMLGENQPIISAAGAVGLMQLMPSTYEQMRKQLGLGSNPSNPHDNILAGTAYLSWLSSKYGYPRMFAAYNAGPAKLRDCIATGKQLPSETQNYVTRIATTLGTTVKLPLVATRHPVHAKSVKFTKPNGAPVWIDAGNVKSVRKPLHGEYAKSARSVIAIGKVRQAVRENVAAVKAALRRAA